MAAHNEAMLDSLAGLNVQDLQGLSPQAWAEVAAQMLARIGEQTEVIARQARLIRFKDVKIERIMFELARLKAYRFGARTERMDAGQRQMFEETLAEDQASLEAQLAALQGEPGASSAPLPEEKTRARPRRAHLPDHLRRVDYRHEPADTTCPTAGCGQAMARIGEDITEKLDVVPAEFLRITATSAASGPAGAARYWCSSRWPPRSSTKAFPPRD